MPTEVSINLHEKLDLIEIENSCDNNNKVPLNILKKTESRNNT